jgi:hypothetical protein
VAAEAGRQGEGEEGLEMTGQESKLLVYVAALGGATVLTAIGDAVREEIATCGTDLTSHWFTAELPADLGLWIWEGIARPTACEHDPPILSAGAWRRLRSNELMRLASGLDPFRSDESQPVFPIRRETVYDFSWEDEIT